MRVLGVHVFVQIARSGFICFLSPCSRRTKCYIDEHFLLLSHMFRVCLEFYFNSEGITVQF